MRRKLGMLVLAIFAGFFGVLMLNLASQIDAGAVYYYMFGAFCLMIAIACVTKGRVRQFVGSLIGCAVFAIAIWYVVTEVAAGVFRSHSRGEPSVLNAIMFFIVFGIPGGAYAYKAGFGFRKQS